LKTEQTEVIDILIRQGFKSYSSFVTLGDPFSCVEP
jgi:hypothetical protein